MKRIAGIMTALWIAGAAGCSSGPANLLLGKWKLDPTLEASPYCSEPLEFRAKTQTLLNPQGKPETVPVTYVTGETKTFPTVVYMETDAGIAAHVTYRFLSRDRMVLDTWLQCTYVRA